MKEKSLKEISAKVEEFKVEARKLSSTKEFSNLRSFANLVRNVDNLTSKLFTRENYDLEGLDYFNALGKIFIGLDKVLDKTEAIINSYSHEVILDYYTVLTKKPGFKDLYRYLHRTTVVSYGSMGMHNECIYNDYEQNVILSYLSKS